MKYFVLVFLLLSVLAISCDIDEDDLANKNYSSITPESTLGRANEIIDTIGVADNNVQLSIWNYGTLDNDVVSLIVNGDIVLSKDTVRSSYQKRTLNVDLKYDGYNYILMYTHYAGHYTHNPVAISIDDGETYQELYLTPIVSNNGAIDIFVD